MVRSAIAVDHRRVGVCVVKEKFGVARCCCATECTDGCASGTTPSQYKVVISSSGSGCCASLAGTYILDKYEAGNSCFWRYDGAPICDTIPGGCSSYSLPSPNLQIDAQWCNGNVVGYCPGGTHLRVYIRYSCVTTDGFGCSNWTSEVLFADQVFFAPPEDCSTMTAQTLTYRVSTVVKVSGPGSTSCCAASGATVTISLP